MTDPYIDIPRLALSIMQPWSWLIVNRYKPIENRDWPTKYRGPVAIHAGKKVDKDCEWALDHYQHPVTGKPFRPREMVWETGGIVGVADVVDCVEQCEIDWFVGRYGFILANQRPVPFIPVNGALGFFDWRAKL